MTHREQSDPAELMLAKIYAAACAASEGACALDAPPAAASPAPARPTPDGPEVIERRALTADIAEYRVAVRVGPGPHDVIGLHRVVRERAPHVPAPAGQAVMMLHGDIWDFHAAFLACGGGAPEASVAVYLAQHDLDVWGVDLGWTLVPAGTADLSFMAGWGFARDTRDLGLALGLARAVRRLSGQGAGPIHLLGWSRGAQLGYVYVAAEAGAPPAQRHVGGFIPVDVYLRSDDPSVREGARQRYEAAVAQIAAGSYASGGGLKIAALGELAKADPGAPSADPAFPGLTNAQIAMLVGGATYLLVQPPPVPLYHHTGGRWDTEAGIVTDLAYTAPARWFDFLSRSRPYQPWRMLADAEALVCDDPRIAEAPMEVHLEQIAVPVLYVAAGGGYGRSGEHTVSLLGSSDVTVHMVSRYPEEQRLFEAGHADIFHGNEAAALFWEPILSWIRAR